uniref:Uncharacterized protein n=1 Tax=Setaria italica TaxID=4555 RepID=K4AGT6_SETIT
MIMCHDGDWRRAYKLSTMDSTMMEAGDTRQVVCALDELTSGTSWTKRISYRATKNQQYIILDAAINSGKWLPSRSDAAINSGKWLDLKKPMQADSLFRSVKDFWSSGEVNVRTQTQ